MEFYLLSFIKKKGLLKGPRGSLFSRHPDDLLDGRIYLVTMALRCRKRPLVRQLKMRRRITYISGHYVDRHILSDISAECRLTCRSICY